MIEKSSHLFAAVTFFSLLIIALSILGCLVYRLDHWIVTS